MDIAALLLRLVVGVFFAISGWHKLFNRERHAALVATLQSDHVPWVSFNQWWVPSVELGAGVALAVGFLTPVAAMLLLVVCAVACWVDGLPNINSRHSPIDRADWLDDVLYLPETLYLVMLLALVCMGSGSLSLDHLLWT